MTVIFRSVTVILLRVMPTWVYKPKSVLCTTQLIIELLPSNRNIPVIRYYCKTVFTNLDYRNNLIISSCRNILMPSTRKQKAKAWISRELDMLSDYDNMEVMLVDGNSNSIERELDSLINGPDRAQDFQSFPNRENSPLENEIRDINSRNERR